MSWTLFDGSVIVLAGDGNDLVDAFQSSGNNQLFGGKGNDELFGEAGKDILNAALDTDIAILNGIQGSDLNSDHWWQLKPEPLFWRGFEPLG